MVTAIVAHQEINNAYYRDLIAVRERVASLTQQLKESNQLLHNAQDTEKRLRASRITYWTRSIKLKEDAVKL